MAVYFIDIGDRIAAWSEAMFVSYNLSRSKLSLIKYALVTAVLIDLSQADTLLPLCIPPAAENSKVNRCKFPVAKNAPIISYLHLQLWQVEASVSFVELLNTDINIWIIGSLWLTGWLNKYQLKLWCLSATRVLLGLLGLHLSPGMWLGLVLWSHSHKFRSRQYG